MELWQVTHDRKAGSFFHSLQSGFGHALMAQTLVPVFRELQISASLWGGTNAWWPLHRVPSLQEFEQEHGVIEARHIHNDRNLELLRRRARPVHSEHAGYFDVFVPVASAKRLVAALVVGPYAQSAPTGSEIRQRWRSLTGREGRLADPQFGAYLTASLETLVLDGPRSAKLEQLLGCLAKLLVCEGRADELANEAERLRLELEPLRVPERTWETVRFMLDDRFRRTPSSSYVERWLTSLGLPYGADHVLVGLIGDLPRKARVDDPVEYAVRRHAFQRSATELMRAWGAGIAGQVGDRGVVFLLGARGGGEKRKRNLIDLSERIAMLGRRKFGLGLHFGASPTSRLLPISRAYHAALRAADDSLARGAKLTMTQAEPEPSSDSLLLLRREIERAVEESPDQLPTRFERYLEAVSSRCGARVEPARVHLEVAFESMTDGLLTSGGLDRKSFHARAEALGRAAAAASTVPDLFVAYRIAVAELAAATGRPVAARRERSLRAALDYIEQHYGEPLRLEQVARVAGFSPDHFSDLFKQQEGLSYADYLRGFRLERAKQLLTDTDLRIARVAELCGFSSVQYFCRVFQRRTGMTPRRHREESRMADRRRSKSATRNPAKVKNMVRASR